MMENFSKIFIINMKEHTDRWIQCQEELKKFNITNYERFEGIRIDGGKTQKLREDGCRASHMFIIKKAKELNLESVLIFEDDIEINPELLNKMPEVEKFLKDINLWHLTYLGGNHNSLISEAPTQITKDIVKVHKTYTTHAYAVNKSCYDKILKFEFREEPIDVILTDIQAEGHSYCVSPRMIYQRTGISYILDMERDYSVVLKGE